MSTSSALAPPLPLSARRKVAYFLLAAGLSLAALLSLLLPARPPPTPRLTFIGLGDALGVLVEGAGGGRVLIGGGATQADLPAALGRQFLPWDRAVDLLLVTDRRDLPGATELVRRGGARAVATVGLAEERAAAAALAALRETCAARGVPLRAIASAERIGIGRDDGATLDIIPAPADSPGAVVRLTVAAFTATLVSGERADLLPTLGAIVLHDGAAASRAVLAADARLIVAPGPPDLPSDGDPGTRQLLLIGPGERATLTLEGARLRLRGAALVPLDRMTANR